MVMSTMLSERAEGWMIYLAVDELEVMGALSIAIASPVLRASLIAGELGHATISGHLDKVDGTVETTGEVGHVDVECKLLVLELEDVVGRVAGHEIDTRTDVGTSNELQGECVTAGSDTVGTSVVSTIKCAVLGTCGTVGAQGGVPSVAGIAVGETAGGVEPTPVRIEDDRSLCGRTTTALRAFLRGEFRMGFCHIGADLLSAHGGEKRKRDESNGIRPREDGMLL
jgi:hypothetical protein